MMLARLEPGAAVAAFFETLEENVRVLRGLGMLDGEIDLAVDMHLIPRYDAAHGPELVRSKNKSGAAWLERYATIQSVTPGLRLVLGRCQCWPPAAVADDDPALRILRMQEEDRLARERGGKIATLIRLLARQERDRCNGA